MKQVDIMEAITTGIDETIFQQWRHEGFIGGFSSEYINMDIDGVEYVLRLYEVKPGENFSQCLELMEGQ